MRLCWVCLVCTGCILAEVSGARILAFLPLPGKSHFIFASSVATALAARGHQVTIMSPISPSKNVSNIKYIELYTMKKLQETYNKNTSFESFLETLPSSSLGLGAFVFWNLQYTGCEEVLKGEEVKKLLASKEKYDLVISEALFGQESVLVLGHLLKAPVVNLLAFGPYSILNRVHGNDLQIASHPDTPSFPFTNQMNFIERFRNFLSISIQLIAYYTYHLPKHQEIIDRAFRDPSIPPLAEMVVNISVSLANFQPTIGYPQTFPSNIVPVGGIHIEDQPPPLPKDVKEFLDRGKNSVIFFSLGSIIPLHLMPPQALQVFLNTFRKLPYKVLWKLDAESLPGLSDNVKIVSWVPQQTVLAHPNVVLFITHGGLLSQLETFHAGVPVVGIPVFGDQPCNVRLYEHLGVGRALPLPLDQLTEEAFTRAILSVAGKQSYVDNMKKVSLLLRDQPMKPADRAVWWVEYVLRHDAAHHLRPLAATLPWYTLALLDIFAAVFVSLLATLYLLKTLLSSICCRRSNTTKTVPSKKKKS